MVNKSKRPGMRLLILTILSLLAGARAYDPAAWANSGTAGCAVPDAATLANLNARNIEPYGDYSVIDPNSPTKNLFQCMNMYHPVPPLGSTDAVNDYEITFTCDSTTAQPEVVGRCVPECFQNFPAFDVEVTYRDSEPGDSFVVFGTVNLVYPILKCKDGYETKTINAIACPAGGTPWQKDKSCTPNKCQTLSIPPGVDTTSWDNNFPLMHKVDKTLNCASGFANGNSRIIRASCRSQCTTNEALKQVCSETFNGGQCAPACTEWPDAVPEGIDSGSAAPVDGWGETTTVGCNDSEYYDGSVELTCDDNGWFYTSNGKCSLTTKGKTCEELLDNGQGTHAGIVSNTLIYIIVLENLNAIPECVTQTVFNSMGLYKVLCPAYEVLMSNSVVDSEDIIEWLRTMVSTGFTNCGGTNIECECAEWQSDPSAADSFYQFLQDTLASEIISLSELYQSITGNPDNTTRTICNITAPAHDCTEDEITWHSTIDRMNTADFDQWLANRDKNTVDDADDADDADDDDKKKLGNGAWAAIIIGILILIGIGAVVVCKNWDRIKKWYDSLFTSNSNFAYAGFEL